MAAAKKGHLDVLRWARENGCPWDNETTHQAVRGGHRKVFQWARQNGCPWEQNTWLPHSWFLALDDGD